MWSMYVCECVPRCGLDAYAANGQTHARRAHTEPAIPVETRAGAGRPLVFAAVAEWRRRRRERPGGGGGGGEGVEGWVRQGWRWGSRCRRESVGGLGEGCGWMRAVGHPQATAGAAKLAVERIQNQKRNQTRVRERRGLRLCCRVEQGCGKIKKIKKLNKKKWLRCVQQPPLTCPREQRTAQHSPAIAAAPLPPSQQRAISLLHSTSQRSVPLGRTAPVASLLLCGCEGNA